MALTLLLGTFTFGFFGVSGVALIVGFKRGGVLFSILVLSLIILLFIFVIVAMDAVFMYLFVDGYLVILGALLVGIAILSFFATAVALRISI